MKKLLISLLDMVNATLKDVAKEADVSVPTVFRALNDEKFVSDNVRRAVKLAAKKLHYEPDWMQEA